MSAGMGGSGARGSSQSWLPPPPSLENFADSAQGASLPEQPAVSPMQTIRKSGWVGHSAAQALDRFAALCEKMRTMRCGKHSQLSNSPDDFYKGVHERQQGFYTKYT